MQQDRASFAKIALLYMSCTVCDSAFNLQRLWNTTDIKLHLISSRNIRPLLASIHLARFTKVTVGMDRRHAGGANLPVQIEQRSCKLSNH